RGVVTCSVLLVNSPHAPAAVQAWQRAGRPMELGWHPCLTLDRPVLPGESVPSLVGTDGRFFPLGTFVKRLYLGLVRPAELEAEYRAQLHRFVDLLGHMPTVVNTHHHVQIFRLVGSTLRHVLKEHGCRPYVRRIRESWSTLRRVRGARCKRAFLSTLGHGDAAASHRAGFPGNEWLTGVT